MGVFGVYFFSCQQKEKEVKPFIQDVQKLVFASGELIWADAYNLTAQTDGVLTKVSIDVGKTVEKGQIVASIENLTNEINRQTAQEQLAISAENLTQKSPFLQQLQQNIISAENNYLQNKKQAERLERLYNRQGISKVEYENGELLAKNSLAQLEALKKQYLQALQQAKQQNISVQNQVKNAKTVEKYNQIIVPSEGKVIKKMKSIGDYVRKGDVLATIANNHQVELVLMVDETSIEEIIINQPVFVRLNTNKNKLYQAKISEILVAFDEQTQSFICKALMEDSLQNTLYGTQLEANILVGEKKNALLIPRNYMGFGNKVRVKGKNEPVIIQTGIISTEYVEVLGGITQEDVLLPLKP